MKLGAILKKKTKRSDRPKKKKKRGHQKIGKKGGGEMGSLRHCGGKTW